MYVHPSGALTGIGYTHTGTGALGNADSLPVGQLYHNGVVDGAVTVTVTNITTGKYKLSCTIPAGYVEGDIVSLEIAATVGGIVDAEVVLSATVSINTPQTGDNYARLGAPTGASVSADIATVLTNQGHILGLVGENQGIRNQQYDSNVPPNLLSCDICYYNSAGNATTNDGITGLNHKWSLSNTYTSGVLTAQSIRLVS